MGNYYVWNKDADGDKRWLAMRAGARAIRNNWRLDGAAYCYDPLGDAQEISYHEAAQLLFDMADMIQAEAELERKGGDDK